MMKTIVQGGGFGDKSMVYNVEPVENQLNDWDPETGFYEDYDIKNYFNDERLETILRVIHSLNVALLMLCICQYNYMFKHGSKKITNRYESKKINAMYYTYLFNRLTNYCGSWIRHCGWYPDAKTRLWKKGTAKWEGIIHEKLVSKAPVRYIKGDILHYSYPSISFHLSKINHFTDFMAKEMFEKGKKGSLTKLILSPPFKFIKKYIFQLGFLDGYAGFIVSTMSAYYVFVKYAKLRSLIKETII